MLLPVHAMHLRLTIDALNSMVEEDNPFTFAQANFYLGLLYSYSVGAFREAKYHCQKAIEAVRRNRIRFVSISTGSHVGIKRENAEELHEKAVFLGQMLYMETHVYLIGQPSFSTKFDLGEEFKAELPVSLVLIFGRGIDFLTDHLQSLYSDTYLHGDQPAEISLELETQFRYELPVRVSALS